MKRSTVAVGAALACGMLAGVVAAQAMKTIHVDSDKATYKDTSPGVSVATVWGDLDKGPYGAFTKFAPGTKVPLHTHPNDIRLVVIKGAYIYKPEKGAEIRVGPGQYLFLPGGDRHESGGDDKEGALFYDTGTRPFGLDMVK
jgi:quercetin dioxygenase-like cupin family protein